MRLLSLPTKDASDPRAPHREFWPQMVRKHRKAPVSFSSMRHSNGQGIGRSYGANAYNVLQECYRHLHQAYSPGPHANVQAAKRVGNIMETNAYFSTLSTKPVETSCQGHDAEHAGDSFDSRGVQVRDDFGFCMPIVGGLSTGASLQPVLPTLRSDLESTGPARAQKT
jgi:hypothetical protein